MTWNVDGLLTKACEVETWSEEFQADIVGIQETKLCEGDRTPRFPGFLSHHGFGFDTKHIRGVSLLTRDTLVVQRTPVRDTPNNIFRRVVYPDKCIIVGSVYLPSGRPGSPFRDEVKRALIALRGKFPQDPNVAMGDWNLDVTGMVKLLSEWVYEAHGLLLATTTMAQGGEGPVHTYASGRVETCIDHFVYWGTSQCPTAVSHAEVNVACHFPVTMQCVVAKGQTLARRDDSRAHKRLRLGSLPLPSYLEVKAEGYVYPRKYLDFVDAKGWQRLRMYANKWDDRLNEANRARCQTMAKYYRLNMHAIGHRCGAVPYRGGGSHRGKGTPRKIKRKLLQKVKSCCWQELLGILSPRSSGGNGTCSSRRVP